MRIIANAYLGKKITGIGRYFIEVISSIAKINPDIEFIIYTNFDAAELLTHDFKSKNILVKPYGVSKSRPVANLLFNAFIFPWIIIKERADLLYVPNFTLLLFKVRPTVAVIYDTIEFKLERKFSKLRTMYRQFIVPRMAQFSDHIITISESSKRDIVELFGVDNGKITITYCAVSDNFSLEKVSAIPTDARYMLYVGTVDHPGKNVYNTLKAFESYKSKCDDSLKFVICGMPGKGFETVSEAIKRSPYINDIVYKGYVGDEELYQLYTHAELFIFTSRYEGFGLPVLEAMRYGLPVITSNRSSLPEVAGDAAFTCNPDDVDEMATAIGRIVNEPILRVEMVRKGYENLKRFSWDDAARGTISVLKMVYSSFYKTNKD